MIDNKGRFVIEDYGKKSGFASFLPGISGPLGIPIWCFYVNRGQCVTSFGVQDKDHSIMEFFPAHQAYERTKKMGFRTFVKVEDRVAEPFGCEKKRHAMHIGMNEIELLERDQENELETTVTYSTLPGEAVGGLLRRVCIRNTGTRVRRMEILDGMPAVIPYGIDLESIKTMGQTMKAWMEVLDHKTGIPFIHARASTVDSSQVTEIAGGNYGMAMDGEGKRLPVIVDPEQIFAYDASFDHPILLEEKSLEEICSAPQVTQNLVPCCFFAKEGKVGPGQEIRLYEIFGQAADHETLERFRRRVTGPEFFEEKLSTAVKLTEELTDKIATKTGDEVFDRYCRQTFLDNVLRGGYPVLLGGKKLFYLYSRKHGDIERDYNYFSMLPEFFSQGNGNFRDVNQNRRCDVQFAPYVGEKNVKTFYNCIQINGYNPLGIEKITYRYPVEGLGDSFTPGELYHHLEGVAESRRDLEAEFSRILSLAECEDRTKFIEGYWTDHWTYNLDLVESYLTVYPEREEELLFGDASYTWLQSKEEILPRSKRYVETKQGIRQYHFLEKNPKAERTYLEDIHGTVVRNTLAEKLFALCVLKTAALDSYGMGVEMEGGKPGWYDALNGLPGLLGSSMCETYETARTQEFVLRALETWRRELRIPGELAKLAEQICSAIETEQPLQAGGAVLSYWNKVNDAKEAYWKATESCVSGEQVCLSWQTGTEMLGKMHEVVLRGIEKALDCGGGISPSYFYYEITAYEKDEDGIHPTEMRQRMLPYFLEGPVRHLKLEMNGEQKKALYQKVKDSGLYDKKLRMYKVNDSLQESTFELGRCRAFTPGWLENESVWLHMEYKYLLELLKSGLYREFLQDFHCSAIPFLNPEVYGRSPLENSSFIASSVNPNPSLRGKGFVARLSGSTAEFLQMWQIMMFGADPFRMTDGKLCLEFRPLLPSYLIGRDQSVEAVFLGNTKVTYHLCDREDYIPGNYRTGSYKVLRKDGTVEEGTGKIGEELALLIRDGKTSEIHIDLER
ncbi:MAG: hypothetical protein Q4E91_08300 [Lachnospiraceae bacterium]|nr:hypothetical protein [Lachnospiraceae bacterium]